MTELEVAIATYGQAAVDAWIVWAEAHNDDPEDEFAAFMAGRASTTGSEQP